ncbi:MAG: oxidative damage protection protein [Gammaproteobacteria bacterium]|nr:oxidative damage protection protein [Gammaproteobacteria bacterium]
MSRTVFCRRHRKTLPGLESPPLPGALGQDIFDNVSAQAWSEWQTVQTMLINERHLNMIDLDARRFLTEQMKKYLNNEPHEIPEGYVPPEQ